MENVIDVMKQLIMDAFVMLQSFVNGDSSRVKIEYRTRVAALWEVVGAVQRW